MQGNAFPTTNGYQAPNYYQQPVYQQYPQYAQQPQYAQPQVPQVLGPAPGAVQYAPQMLPQLPQAPPVAPPVAAPAPAQEPAQEPKPLVPPQHGQAQPWNPPSQLQADQQAQRQAQMQAAMDQNQPQVQAPQAQAPQIPPRVQPDQKLQLVVTATMIALARELHELFKNVQRCEIAANSQQPIDIPRIGVVQPSNLASTVNQLLTQAAQTMRSLDELVQKGNHHAPIDVQERLVQVLCENPEQPPPQL